MIWTMYLNLSNGPAKLSRHLIYSYFFYILLHSTIKFLNFIGQNNLFSITAVLAVVPAAIQITNLY